MEILGGNLSLLSMGGLPFPEKKIAKLCDRLDSLPTGPLCVGLEGEWVIF